MKCEVLINFISDYNDHNIVALYKMQPEEAIFIRLNNEDEKEIFNELEEFLREKMPRIKVEERIVGLDDLSKIKDILLEYKGKQTIINISGGSRIQAIYANQIARINNIQSMIVDMQSKKIYSISNDELTEYHEKFIELSIKDILESTGKDILFEATNDMDELIKAGIVDFIIRNLDIWNDVKRIFTDRNKVLSCDESYLTMSVRWKTINMALRNKIYELMNILERNRLIYVYSNNKYAMKFKFKNIGIKRYFLISGSWLEALTYKCIKEIKGTDDAKSGVVFVWDDNNRIKNEIDVMAALDSTLVCISCKDTKNYDEDDLNEIDVYAEELGGEDVIKILVSTHQPHKRTVSKRAKEMDIDLIIFDGDVEKFKRNLKLAINKDFALC
ncbi:Card1-like endonuclease domain-containing protein [Paramaledivibacter caminithermalis]|uniref:Card1 endonuclease domain-containing protein n=1 Tax=Paramaledivibacter caminithermalis (strain DSM 15212 / CIP 107654 / DViRD3) TaxID=1121301 RepID=A0A1M6KQ30_PARC5|nr:DUF1887 family CARF protein [Paramaledivibacter caminithermalis]SHJ60992.1 protein of unknown function [Paramaledivibacter caminithermalis DSM 15212]